MVCIFFLTFIKAQPIIEIISALFVIHCILSTTFKGEPIHYERSRPISFFEGFVKKHLGTPQNIACTKGFSIFSVISYLYFVTNDLNNYDNIATLTHGYGTGVSSGRWFLQILGDWMQAMRLDFNLPFINALTALIFLCLAAFLVIRILHIENRLLCFGIGAITASFPTIAATMFFSYTVHYYCLGLLLSAAGVYLALNTKWFRIFASALFCLSLGIYQAYYPFAAMLFVLALIRETLDETVDWKAVVKNAFIYLALFALGYGLYMILSRYFLQVYGCVFNDYQGISSMGKLDLRQLPRMVKNVFKYYIRLYRMDYCSVSATYVIRFCIGLSFLCDILLVALDWKKRSLMKNLELCVLLLLLPVAANSIIIMVPQGGIYTIMVMGLIALYYLPILLVQNLRIPLKPKKALILLVCVTTLLASGDYAYQSNGNYRSLYYQNRKTENYFTVMLSQIRSTPGYREDMEIVFIGSSITDSSLNDNWQKYIFQYGGKSESAMSAINAYSRPDFFYQYFGYYVRNATAEELSVYASQIEEMNTYPNSGSIRIIGNIVFVNCG